MLHWQLRSSGDISCVKAFFRVPMHSYDRRDNERVQRQYWQVPYPLGLTHIPSLQHLKPLFITFSQSNTDQHSRKGGLSTFWISKYRKDNESVRRLASAHSVVGPTQNSLPCLHLYINVTRSKSSLSLRKRGISRSKMDTRSAA